MELNSKQFKLPHQMSPEEFAAHPAAVFHSTFLPDTDVFDLSKRDPGVNSALENFKGVDDNGNDLSLSAVKKVHLGTFQAALDALRMRGRTPEQEGTIHSFWQTPKVPGATSEKRIDDYIEPDWDHDKEEIDNPENVAHFIPGSQYYENQNEDEGSPSFATDEPSKHLASHADYVKAALNKGVPESDIHPRTLAQYKAGTLGKMSVNSHVAKLMINHQDKLGPLKKAGPEWEYLYSDEPAPKRPEEK